MQALVEGMSQQIVLRDWGCRRVSEARRTAGHPDEWAVAIGQSVVAFAKVEHAVTVLIRQCTVEALGRKMSRLDLSGRLATFGKLLQESGLARPEQRLWRSVRQKIEALCSKYQTILSYGTPLRGPIEFTGDALIARASHKGRRSDELLTLPQLALATQDIQAAHAEFVTAATQILDSLVAEDRLLLSSTKTRGGQFS
jgi:hypothetical protein